MKHQAVAVVLILGQFRGGTEMYLHILHHFNSNAQHIRAIKTCNTSHPPLHQIRRKHTNQLVLLGPARWRREHMLSWWLVFWLAIPEQAQADGTRQKLDRGRGKELGPMNQSMNHSMRRRFSLDSVGLLLRKLSGLALHKRVGDVGEGWGSTAGSLMRWFLSFLSRLNVVGGSPPAGGNGTWPGAPRALEKDGLW